MDGSNHPAGYYIIKFSYKFSRFIAINFQYAIDSTILLLYSKSTIWNICLVQKVSTKLPTWTCAQLFFHIKFFYIMESSLFIFLIYLIVLTVLADSQPLQYLISYPIPRFIVHIIVSRAVNILSNFFIEVVYYLAKKKQII